LCYLTIHRSVKEDDEDVVDDATSNFRVSLISERETNGAVLSLTSVKGRLVAGINSKLQVFRWVDGSDHISVPELKSECGHHGHLLALLLKSRGDVLALGDILQSITMLKFDEEASKLEEVARDFTCNYMRAIEIMDDNVFVGAEDNENIFFVRRDTGPSSTDSGRLELSGEFHVGETINVFQHGTLSNRPAEQSPGGSAAAPDGIPADGEKVESGSLSASQSVLFGTVSGAIGTILSIDETTYTLFRALQKCIQSVVHSVGGLPHTDWRNFANDKKFGSQTNTVDGDLIEMFLELTPAEMNRVVSLLNDELCSAVPVGSAGAAAVDPGVVTVEAIRTRIEAVSRCH
jgi:DNA damage-binding protein 1